MSPREAGAHHRRKGLVGEREVFDRFVAAGGRVLKLENQGDNVVELADVIYHVETKRREQTRIEEWCHQAESEVAWKGVAVPVVVWRKSREPWRIAMPLTPFLEVVTNP